MVGARARGPRVRQARGTDGSPGSPGVVPVAEFEAFLKGEGCWFEPPDPLAAWNPEIFEATLPESGSFRKKDTFAVFLEISRRVGCHALHGQGRAPPGDPGTSFKDVFASMDR